MLIFSRRRAAIIRIPTLALMVAALWCLIELPAATGAKRSSAGGTAGFALAFCAAFSLGFRVFRRIENDIVSSGLLGTRRVPARHAVLGIRMRGGGRYWGLDLDLMAHPDFTSRDVVTIDSFTPSGTEAVIGAAQRAATLLGLPDPILAPGLPGFPSRSAGAPDGVAVRDRFNLRRRWGAASPWSKFLVVVALASVGWMVCKAARCSGAAGPPPPGRTRPVRN